MRFNLLKKTFIFLLLILQSKILQAEINVLFENRYIVAENSLANTVAKYYKNNDWYYVALKLDVFNKEIKKNDFYIIKLNPKSYNDFSKKVKKSTKLMEQLKISKYLKNKK